MGDLSTKNANERGPAYHVQAQAYCLRAFCNQEKEPNSKVFLEDTAKAEELWFMEEHKQFAEQNPLVSEYTFKLLHRVCDLLLIKDCMEDHHFDLYELMIKYCLWRSYSLEECMIMLWQSKRLSHSFCTSPINDVFLKAFSEHCPMYNSMKYWRDCFAMLEPTDVGFWNNMSIISTVPSQDYNDDEAIGQAKLCACDLIGKVHMSTKSVYLVANIFYDLGERMIAKGFMTEISRLLLIIYILPGTYKDVSLMPSSSDVLSQSEWASFFHQALLGTNLNQEFSSHLEKVPNQSS